MRRQFAALLAVLGLIASACTSSADADIDAQMAALSATPRMSSQEAQAARLVEDFFAALQQRNAYALYALFSPDDQCRPARIAELLDGVDIGIAETSEVEVDDIQLRPVGAYSSLSFTLIEHQGAADKELVYEEFFPAEQLDNRWRFAANLCEWLAAPTDGDYSVRQELELAMAALEAFQADYGTYLASGNDLRYYASGLNATMDELALMPGDVLVVPGDEQALLVGQGIGGGWYCIAVGMETGPVYGSGSSIEDVIMFDACAANASASGW
jgi:hypothetical protein